jgi:hypothetical protein
MADDFFSRIRLHPLQEMGGGSRGHHTVLEYQIPDFDRRQKLLKLMGQSDPSN